MALIVLSGFLPAGQTEVEHHPRPGSLHAKFTPAHSLAVFFRLSRAASRLFNQLVGTFVPAPEKKFALFSHRVHFPLPAKTACGCCGFAQKPLCTLSLRQLSVYNQGSFYWKYQQSVSVSVRRARSHFLQLQGWFDGLFCAAP